MKNECTKYAESIRDDIKAIYDGSTEETNEDGEQMSIYDYICSEVLDYETLHDSNKEPIGCNLYVTLGGPTCWIDTRHNEVICRWGTEDGRAWLPEEISEEINEAMREMTCY